MLQAQELAMQASEVWRCMGEQKEGAECELQGVQAQAHDPAGTEEPWEVVGKSYKVRCESWWGHFGGCGCWDGPSE